jgi:tRNA (cmo5U34)-methyltransferase
MKSAAQAFDEAAPDYDSWVRKALPTYEELFNVATEVVPLERGEEICVADLGAGSGLFSARLLKAFPKARFELFDASTEMLDRARKRFASRDNQFSFNVLDMTSFHSTSRFDAVVSSLAIHHLEHDQKRELFRQIWLALRPGGVFVNVDQVRGDSGFSNLYWDAWLRKVREAGAPESQIQASIARRREFDRDASLSDQLSWLQSVGFEADCIYKHYFVAVFLAIKPAA